MPKLHSSRHIIAVLMKKGFIEIDQPGSHKKLRKDDRTVIVPSPRKEMPQMFCHELLKWRKQLYTIADEKNAHLMEEGILTISSMAKESLI